MVAVRFPSIIEIEFIRKVVCGMVPSFHNVFAHCVLVPPSTRIAGRRTRFTFDCRARLVHLVVDLRALPPYLTKLCRCAATRRNSLYTGLFRACGLSFCSARCYAEAPTRALEEGCLCDCACCYFRRCRARLSAQCCLPLCPSCGAASRNAVRARFGWRRSRSAVAQVLRRFGDIACWGAVA